MFKSENVQPQTLQNHSTHHQQNTQGDVAFPNVDAHKTVIKQLLEVLGGYRHTPRWREKIGVKRNKSPQCSREVIIAELLSRDTD